MMSLISGFVVTYAASAAAGGLVATVIVITGLVLLVSLFERRRARHIEHDLHDMAIERHVQPVHLHQRSRSNHQPRGLRMRRHP